MILERVSVSQIASFDPTQPAGCPRRWWFRYVAGKPEPETASKSKGKDFHTSIEHYLKTGEDVLSPEVRAGKHLIRRGEERVRNERLDLLAARHLDVRERTPRREHHRERDEGDEPPGADGQ